MMEGMNEGWDMDVFSICDKTVMRSARGYPFWLRHVLQGKAKFFQTLASGTEPLIRPCVGAGSCLKPLRFLG